MTEKEWTRQIIDAAHLYGWACVHFLPAVVKGGRRWRTPYQGDGRGWPDLFLVFKKPFDIELLVRKIKSIANSDTHELVAARNFSASPYHVT